MNINKYKALYVTEAEEILLALENGIMGLERDVFEPGTLDELFRQAHNLKGISGAMAYDDVMAASHILENALDKIRKGETILAGRDCDVLLIVVDRLRALVKRATEQDGAASDPGELKEFERLLEDFPKAESARGQESARETAVSATPAAAGGADASADGARYKSDTGSIKVNMESLDRLLDQVGELITSRMRLLGLAKEAGVQNIVNELASLSRLTSDIQNEVVELRLVPVGQVFERFKRLVRDLSRDTGKKVQLTLSGSSIGLDRTVLEGMVDPLIHLVRNAVDHGIESASERQQTGKPETATIAISARRERNTVILEVSDDGRGVVLEKILARRRERGLPELEPDQLSGEELCGILTTPGFSTSEKVDNISGRGMGMNIVKEKVEKIGGTMEVVSEQGEGTTFILHLPISLSIIRALLFKVGEDVHAVPIEYVQETVRIEPESLRSVRGREVLVQGEEVIPVIRPQELYGRCERQDSGRYMKLLLIAQGTRKAALVISEMCGQQDVVVKGLPGMMSHLSGISGATILENGRIVFIWDPKIFLHERCNYEHDAKPVAVPN
jgi:two-component system chemotaxis sensor kinase CheA